MISKSCFLLLALLLLASATASLGQKDPEAQRCKSQCRRQHQSDEREARRCIRRCEDRSPGVVEEVERRSPVERLRECSRDCERRQQGEPCQRRCQEEYEKEKQIYEGGGGRPEKEYEVCYELCRRGSQGAQCESRCEELRREREEGGNSREEFQEEERESPYVFEDRHFFTGVKTKHGRLRVLQKFRERSELLRGIENYRLAIFEAQPQTFTVPSHNDAETIVFVAKGKGTVSTVQQEKRESFNIREGDIFRIRAGALTYLINRDNNQRFVGVKLIKPVNTPGEFEAFFGAGGENPQSFFRAFSDDILEAAFNTRRDRVKRLFGQQKEGVIIKASEEQIRGLSQHGEGGIWPFGGESKGTHSLFDQRPTYSNQYGQLYEVDPSQFRQLRDLDVAVSLANISQGAMTGPYYNSKATKIAVVVYGQGYFEMACPHLSQSQSHHRVELQHHQAQLGTGYQKVKSSLKVGTVVVVPAGHPFVAVASDNQNLQILCFEINAYNNQKFSLAGKRNVFNELEREAKELAFGVPAREVEEVFRSQPEEFFFKGPRQGRSEE